MESFFRELIYYTAARISITHFLPFGKGWKGEFLDDIYYIVCCGKWRVCSCTHKTIRGWVFVSCGMCCLLDLLIGFEEMVCVLLEIVWEKTPRSRFAPSSLNNL